MDRIGAIRPGFRRLVLLHVEASSYSNTGLLCGVRWRGVILIHANCAASATIWLFRYKPIVRSLPVSAYSDTCELDEQY